MIDGFWIVYAQSKHGNAGGVAVFMRGKIYGGDSGFYYVGTYEGDKIVKARIAVRNFDSSIPNILGVAKDYELHVTATVDGDTMKGTAVVPGVPSESMSVRLVRKSNL